MEADEEIDNLEEEEVFVIELLAEVLERRQKDKLPALRNIPKNNITKTNELFYAGATVVTNRLGGKINKAAIRKDPMLRRRL